MSLIPRTPFGLIGNLQDEMNQLFDTHLLASSNPLSASSGWVPDVDIHEDENHYYVTMDLPGITSKAIEVTQNNGLLSIKGEREEIHEDKQAHRSERSYGSFMRQFSMPEDADLEAVNAHSEHGVLKITIPKRQGDAAPKRIDVQGD